MRNNKLPATKESILRQKTDNERPLRVAKYIDFPFLLKDSPVEVIEGYIVSDRDTCDVFASFVFKNVSERPIKALSIRLSFYLNQNIPYKNIDFTYCQSDLTFGIIAKNGNALKLRDANKKSTIEISETFGSCVLIPLPESYFTKLDVTLLTVEYADGEVGDINAIVTSSGKRYKELDDISKLVYSRVNIYQTAEEMHPTVVLPQFSNQVWLCCCGNKNPNSIDHCERCGREKDWQKKSVSESALAETREKMVNDPREITLHDKSKFKQNKHLESEAEVQKKIERYEQAMRNVALAEKRKQHNARMAVPKMLLWILSVFLIIAVIRAIVIIGNGETNIGNILSYSFYMLF